jgi:hypothetical protein
MHNGTEVRYSFGNERWQRNRGTEFRYLPSLLYFIPDYH